MFDLAWSEIALIAVVALVVIGPKDLPEAVRGLARGVQKLRRMAGQFQQQADDLVREANLDEVRQQIHDIRNFNIRDTVEKAVDGDGSIRRTFTEDPLRTDYPMPPPYSPPAPEAAAMEGAAAPPGSASAGAAPAFVPPAFIPPAAVEAAAPLPDPPVFVPPAEPAPPVDMPFEHAPLPEPAIRSA
jgi:sec-independent protein translocase protein TatB